MIAKKESRGSYNAANVIWYPSGKGGGAFKLISISMQNLKEKPNRAYLC